MGSFSAESHLFSQLGLNPVLFTLVVALLLYCTVNCPLEVLCKERCLSFFFSPLSGLMEAEILPDLMVSDLEPIDVLVESGGTCFLERNFF